MKEELKEKVNNFDLIDERLNNDINIFKDKLERNRYNDLISFGTIYDNFQIFLPLDINIPRYVDYTGKNDWYWSLIIVGNLLIDFFRDGICHRIPLSMYFASMLFNVNDENFLSSSIKLLEGLKFPSLKSGIVDYVTKTTKDSDVISLFESLDGYIEFKDRHHVQQALEVNDPKKKAENQTKD